jgi:uncharacterized protein (DUF58 family)
VPRDAEPAPLAPLAPGERLTLRLAFTPRRRGRIEFSGLTLGRPDPLGLVKGLARVPLPARLVGMSKRSRLRRIALLGRRQIPTRGSFRAAPRRTAGRRGGARRGWRLASRRPAGARMMEDFRAHRQARGQGIPG